MNDLRIPRGSDPLLDDLFDACEIQLIAAKTLRHENPTAALAAVRELKSLNETVERRLRLNHPSVWQAIVADTRAAHENKLQSEIRDIAAEAAERDLWFPSQPIIRRSLPWQFDDLVDYACKRLWIPQSKRPTIYVVSGIFSTKASQSNRIIGQYLRDTNSVEILSGLADEQTERTLVHELSHCADAVRGRPPGDESFARWAEKEYTEAFHAEQKDARARAEIARQMGWDRE